MSQNPTSSRAVRDRFEKKILKHLRHYGFSPTAGSGSVWQDGDLIHEDFVAECKVKGNTKGFSVSPKEIEHVKKQAEKIARDWLIFEQNAHNEVMVLMDLNTFEMIFDEYVNRDNDRA